MDSFIVMSTDHVQEVHLCLGANISLDISACYEAITRYEAKHWIYIVCFLHTIAAALPGM